MHVEYDPPAVIPVVIAAALLVFVLFRMWRSRQERVGPWLIATIAVLLSWAVGLTFELTSPQLQAKLFWANLEFVPIMCLPLIWLITLRRIVDARAPRRWWQLCGWAVTALLVAAVFINPGHLYRGHPSLALVDGQPALNYDYRILFYAGLVPWAAVLLLAGAALLVRGMSQTPLIFRRRNQILLVASLLPMMGLAVYLSDTLPWHSFDPTFTCVSAAVLLCGLAVLRYRVLDVVPLARDAVIEHLAGGVIVLDALDRIIDFNPAAQAICPRLDAGSIGSSIKEVLDDQPAIVQAMCRAGSVQERRPAGESGRATDFPATSVENSAPTGWAGFEESAASGGIADEATIVIDVQDGDSLEPSTQRHYAVSITPVCDRDGGRVGSALILYDVTRRVELFREVQQMAVTDELTGLSGRRHFRDLANHELLRAVRQELPLSLLLFDIDGFKAVNDTFGHHVGDEVLRLAATACREQLRAVDLFSRYGGDEFCALLPQVTASQAMQVAERLRATVAAQRHLHEDGVVRITVSVGVVGVDVLRRQTLGDLIRAADQALYRAKREGKDCVVQYSGDAGSWKGMATTLLGGEHPLSVAAERDTGVGNNVMGPERRLRPAEDRLGTLFEQAPVGVFLFDRELTITQCNERMTEMLGCPRQRLLGFSLDSTLENPLRRSALAVLEGDQETYEGPYHSALTDRDVWISASAAPLLADDGSIEGGIVVIADLTDHKNATDLVEKLAFYDVLTGLPNPALFRDRLRQAVAVARRSGRPLAVAAVNVDRFNRIRDSFGQQMADGFLQHLAQALTGAVHDRDTLSRSGPNDFLVLLSELRDVRDATTVCERLVSAGRGPWTAGEQTFHASVGIGIALFPGDAETDEELIQCAEWALRRAKESGPGSYRFFDEGMSTHAKERLGLETQLHKALEQGQFVVYYQPQIDLRSFEIVGAEALVRWAHADRGLLLPGEFISLAEESGIIAALDRSVLGTACAEIGSALAAGRDLRLAVNLSARGLGEPDIAEGVSRVLRACDLAASRLEIEITETAAMANGGVAGRAVAALKSLGITVALDDFGTGYSSLSHLQELAVQRLKIDRAFVKDLPDSPESAAIASAVISLAHSLGIAVMAEGVETKEQLDFLVERGCDECQGYLFARPMPIRDLASFLAEWSWHRQKAAGTSPSALAVT
jgi:diguanylate cyclase (GGDEF)-like protein/PAS domain S-box-containing protein